MRRGEKRKGEGVWGGWGGRDRGGEVSEADGGRRGEGG